MLSYPVYPTAHLIVKIPAHGIPKFTTGKIHSYKTRQTYQEHAITFVT
jgi:hypothetical protein